MISLSEEVLRILWKALVTSTIPIVMWYVEAMEIISRIMGAARTVEQDCSKSMPFTWGPQLA